MKFELGKNTLLRRVMGKSARKTARRKAKEQIEKRTNKRKRWIKANPEKAEALRLKRVEDYLRKKNEETQ